MSTQSFVQQFVLTVSQKCDENNEYINMCMEACFIQNLGFLISIMHDRKRNFVPCLPVNTLICDVKHRHITTPLSVSDLHRLHNMHKIDKISTHQQFCPVPYKILGKQ